MCSMNDDPSMHEPLEDSVDWARLRKIRDERETIVTLEERLYGIPARQGWAAHHADGARHSEARRGGLR